MANAASDAVFSGSVPQLYEQYLVPLIFQPYANDLARRALALAPRRVLETACGTGVVTRALRQMLPADVDILATDLNAPMLERAQAIGTGRPVQWQQADAQELPAEDGAFDLVVCQFGAMFFPDEARAFSEARRVLRPGGTLLFSVWGRIEDNEFADVVTETVSARHPDNPPRFLARTPHGHYDREPHFEALRSAGFTAALSYETIDERSRAESAQVVAIAYCQGTPLRGELEKLGADLAEETAACTQAIAARFGNGAVDGKIQAHVISARK
jgi:ubiquinone/menaquinone biosynthesis C-methylase UbiE